MLLEQQRDNEKTCFVKGWDVTPKQNAKWKKSKTKWLTVQHPSWISFSGDISVLPSIHNHLSFWECCGDNMIDDTIFHQLNLPLKYQPPTRFLKFLQLFNWNGRGHHHDIHISCMDYTAYEAVVA
jgi:hypothetical protein